MRKNFRRAADSPAADQSRPHWIKGQGKHHAFERVMEAHHR